MPEINPYEAPQSDASAPPLAEAAPLYPAWNTHAINVQMLAIVLTFASALTMASPSLETVGAWSAGTLIVLIEVLAVILTWTAFKYRVYWLLISELSLLIPAIIGLTLMIMKWSL